MTDNTIPVTPPQKRNPYTLWFVVLSFVAPVALAYVIYYFGNVTGFNNHGELITPVIDITVLELKDEDGNRIPENTLNEEGNVIPEQSLRFKWRFYSFIGADCDEACNKRLYETRQVHRALGKNHHRIIRVIVHLEPPSEALKALIAEEYSDSLTMHATDEEIQQGLGADAGFKDNELYIVDPMGNIMMRFTQDQPSSEIKHDVYKLLKASQIG